MISEGGLCEVDLFALPFVDGSTCGEGQANRAGHHRARVDPRTAATVAAPAPQMTIIQSTPRLLAPVVADVPASVAASTRVALVVENAIASLIVPFRCCFPSPPR